VGGGGVTHSSPWLQQRKCRLGLGEERVDLPVRYTVRPRMDTRRTGVDANVVRWTIYSAEI
jgi:hypothetical protein